MTLTEYFVNLISIIFAPFFVDFHAVVCSFGALNMEVYLAFLLVTFHRSSNINTFFTTYYASDAEFLKIQPVHPHWCLRCDLRSLSPH